MKKQSIWVFQWRKSVHYWWSYILFSPECKELTSMLDPLLYRWGVPPVVIRCVHWTMQMWVLQTWIKALGLYIVMKFFIIIINKCFSIVWYFHIQLLEHTEASTEASSFCRQYFWMIFLWINMFELWIKFHWYKVLCVWLAISQHWFW